MWDRKDGVSLRWKYIVKLNIKEIIGEDVDWILMAWDRANGELLSIW
jgi:hypothetical protein